MPTLIEFIKGLLSLGKLQHRFQKLADAAIPMSPRFELEMIDVLECLSAWGYAAGHASDIKELVHRGLATYEGAETPDYEYGQITEAGREYLAEWGVQNANPD